MVECTGRTVLGYSIMDLCQFLIIDFLIGHELCEIHLCGSIFLKISSSCLIATQQSSAASTVSTHPDNKLQFRGCYRWLWR